MLFQAQAMMRMSQSNSGNGHHSETANTQAA
jgi:hypothetical protein